MRSDDIWLGKQRQAVLRSLLFRFRFRERHPTGSAYRYRLTIGLTAIVTAVTLVRPQPAVGQSNGNGADNTSASMDIESSDFAECARILKSSPANELKQHTDDGTYSTFQEKQLSPLLVGVKCSPQQIKDYMKQAGWVFVGEEPMNYQGKYKADYVMSFNKSPRGIVNRIVLGRVSGLGTFSLYDGKITSILMSPSK